MKNRLFKIFLIASSLLIYTHIAAQDLPKMASDAAVSHVVMPDGLECFVAANPYVSAFADFALVSRQDGKIIKKMTDVVTLREEKVDSSLLCIMKKVEAHGSPSDLAVIVCGDVNASAIFTKLKYMSYMIPEGASLPVASYLEKGLAPVRIMQEGTSHPEISLVRAEWTTPRTPENLVGTIQKAVYDKAVYEFGQAVCNRVKSGLRRKNIACADVRFNHVGSTETYGDERLSLSVTVGNVDVAQTAETVKEALSDVKTYGAPAAELITLENRYFHHLTNLSSNFERSNASYVKRCVSAFLFGAPVASSKVALEFHQSKDMSPQVREKVFATVASALVDMEEVMMENRVSEVSVNLSDTLAFPDLNPEVKVSLRSSKKDPMSGSFVWTFSNGFKVIYKKMPSGDGSLYYSLSMNGGFGDVPELSKGEGAFMSDYQDWCYIAGMKAKDFKDVLNLAGITMNTQVNLSNIMVNGAVADGNAPLLMKSLLAFANERTLDEKEFSYYRRNQEIRLHSQSLGVGTIRSVIDSLMCPGYKYSIYKKSGVLSERTAAKAHALFDEMSSKMNDGVLVLVGNMDEVKLRKLITPYVGSFRTRNTAFFRQTVQYQPVSGWTTYSSEGRRNAIIVAMSTRLSMTTENMLTAEMATMALKDILERSFEGEGFNFNVFHTSKIIPEDRFSVMITIENEGAEIPDEFLWRLRRVINAADKYAMDPEYISACKAFLKKQYEINSQDYRYWLHVIAMRQLDGKDFTTGYVNRIDAVTPEKTSSVLSLLENGSKIEYVIKKR